MEKLFLTVLNMSVTASVVIIAVLLVRLALREAPKVFSYSLWAIVLFRLLCPVTIKSRFSIISYFRDFLQSVLCSDSLGAFHIKIDNAIGSITTGNGISTGLVLPQGQESSIIPTSLNWTLIVSILWLAGVAVMLGYSIWSMVKFRRNLAGFMRLEGTCNVRLVDHISSPFVWGLSSPQIYLPSDLPESEQDYILLHERTHIRRKDHIFRALAWLALTVHWFNPLVWLAFYLAGKDMEMSCDETVLYKMGWWVIRTDYSTSLLRLSVGGKLPAGPLAFGGGDLKRRIKNILNFRTPDELLMLIALAIVLIAGTTLATDPGGLIPRASVTSYTQILAPATWSVLPDGASVYTAADRRQDSLNPTDTRELRKEDGDALVRLINSHRSAIYGQGELELGGSEHNLFRINCVDGGYFLVDYWHSHRISLNPFHAGKTHYTTLVTRYDAEGSAGTTWQMEYNFAHVFQYWWRSLDYSETV